VWRWLMLDDLVGSTWCRPLLAAALLLVAAPALALPMNGLPAGTSVSNTDTIAVCQKATGCGTTDPLGRVTLGSVTMGVGATGISGAITLGSTHQNRRMAVTGGGYVISLPTSTQSPPVLPANSTIELIAAQGAGPVDVCPAGSTSIFTANSGAPLVPGLCPSGQSGWCCGTNSA
jgi:hypothetical protein